MNCGNNLCPFRERPWRLLPWLKDHLTWWLDPCNNTKLFQLSSRKVVYSMRSYAGGRGNQNKRNNPALNKLCFEVEGKQRHCSFSQWPYFEYGCIDISISML